MNSSSVITISGTGVVPGAVYGPAVWAHPRPELPEAGDPIPESEHDAEYARFEKAADTVAERLARRSEKASGDAAEVLKATAGMARDRGWRKAVKKNVGNSQRAEFAVVGATKKFMDMLEKAGGYMAERTTDLADVRDRVIAELSGHDEPGLPDADGPSVLFADDLAPADTAGLNTDIFIAMVTELGGPTSHSAIIARQLGVPCIVAVGKSLYDIDPGDQVLIDGAAGTISRGVDEDIARAMVAESEEKARTIAEWSGPGRTRDGHGVQLLANIADAKAARKAAQTEAEGGGLYRTELSFLSTTKEPSIDEQAEIYGGVFEAFGDSKVVVRTLDAGSDKPIAYATLANEDNPALGVRGLRLARDNEGLLTRQLDAIALAAGRRSDNAQTWVMAPMLATAKEAEWFAGLCRERGLTPGAMVEVPAVALMADAIMPFLDFVSIGTNDLTQYTMAADRLSSQLAYLTDPWQPAVLKLIQMTCEAGRRSDIPVGVCGEAAADPVLACVLTGMGAQSLSTAATALPAVGAQLAEVDYADCQKMAEAALAASGNEQARAAALAVIGR